MVSRKRWMASIALVAVAIVVGITVFPFFFFSPTPPAAIAPLSPEVILSSASLAQWNTQQPQRESYGIPTQVFSDLPSLPNDFGLVAKLLQENKLRFDQISAPYYAQPEFLPQFEERALSFWKKPDATRWFVQGYGFYPSNDSISLRAGESKSVVSFVHTSFGVRTYQGIRLNTIIESNAQEFLSVRENPETVLLEPAFPKFFPNWIQRLTIIVSANAQAIPGDYSIELNPVAPPSNQSQSWQRDHAGYYFEGANNPLGVPPYELRVHIE